jgi:hypothetical protein
MTIPVPVSAAQRVRDITAYTASVYRHLAQATATTPTSTTGRLELVSDLFLDDFTTLSRPCSAGPTVICIGSVVGRSTTATIRSTTCARSM